MTEHLYLLDDLLTAVHGHRIDAEAQDPDGLVPRQASKGGPMRTSRAALRSADPRKTSTISPK